MTTRLSSPLPTPLVPWAEALAPLDPALAVALGPMVRALDDLIGRLDAQGGDVGELDGFDGTVRRGDPERLLLSEWALADAVPLEFLRRAAENELVYLRRSYKSTRTKGKVVVACDVGPDQVGPGRLVQLAAIVVLAQRAHNVGAEFELRILQTGERSDGGLLSVLPRWLRSRSALPATSANCTDAAQDLDTHDRLWLLLGSPTIAPALHRRLLVARVSSWNAKGVAEMTVTVGDSTTHLQVPPGPVAIAALRGEGLLARRSPSFGRIAGTARGARFNSADNRLLWRGELDNEVRWCRVSDGLAAKIGTHRAPGSVLAGAYLGRRLVLAISRDSRVRIHVVGKQLASVHAIDVAHSDLGLREEHVAAMLAEPLRPLYLSGGNIMLQIADQWWVLSPEGTWQSQLQGIHPGTALDAPRTAHNTSNGLWIDNRRVQDTEAARFVFGPVSGDGPWHARSQDLRAWTAGVRGDTKAEIGVPEGERVLGLMLLPRPTLVTLSNAGVLVRHFTEQDTYTWTRWSGPGEYAVHPTRPWVVRTTEEGITVGDLASQATLLELRSEA